MPGVRAQRPSTSSPLESGMEKQTGRQKVVTAAVGKIFKPSDAAPWRLAAVRAGDHDEPRRDGAGDAGRFPELVADSRERTPCCAGCVVGLAWSAWRLSCEALPGRGLQLYALCEQCQARDRHFKEACRKPSEA